MTTLTSHEPPPPNLDPATTEELGAVADLGVDETKAAIEAANKAFKSWSRLTAKVGRLTGKVAHWALTVDTYRNVMTSY